MKREQEYIFEIEAEYHHQPSVSIGAKITTYMEKPRRADIVATNRKDAFKLAEELMFGDDDPRSELWKLTARQIHPLIRPTKDDEEAG